MDSPLYQQMRELRNKVLLRPLGLPDNSWEMHDKISSHYVVVQGIEIIACPVLVPIKENSTSIQIIQMPIQPCTLQTIPIFKEKILENYS